MKKLNISGAEKEKVEKESDVTKETEVKMELEKMKTQEAEAIHVNKDTFEDKEARKVEKFEDEKTQRIKNEEREKEDDKNIVHLVQHKLEGMVVQQKSSR